MTLSNKRALLNYLQFLKSSGCLYMEGGASLEPPAAAAADQDSPPARSRSQAAASSRQPALSPKTPAKPATTSPAAAVHAPLTGPSLSRADRIERLAAACREADACRACELGARRNKIVYGDGDPEARIVFVGEAPGADEDASGIPFVGRAGKLLEKMITAIGFERGEVFICNTLKCRPPDNRDPLPAEKAACEHFLVEQLDILRPSVLVALGAHAAQYLCRSEETIGRLRGRWHDYHGIPLRATYHPAFLLRSPSFKARAWEDFQAIHAKYSELNPDQPREIWSKE